MKGLPEFPVDQNLLTTLKERVMLAMEIDKLEHKTRKESHEIDWFSKNAEALDIELDETMYVLYLK